MRTGDIPDALGVLRDLSQSPEALSMSANVFDPSVTQGWTHNTQMVGSSNIGTVPVVYSSKAPAMSYTASTVTSTK